MSLSDQDCKMVALMLEQGGYIPPNQWGNWLQNFGPDEERIEGGLSSSEEFAFDKLEFVNGMELDRIEREVLVGMHQTHQADPVFLAYRYQFANIYHRLNLMLDKESSCNGET